MGILLLLLFNHPVNSVQELGSSNSEMPNTGLINNPSEITLDNETLPHKFIFMGASNTAESEGVLENGSYVTKLRDAKYDIPWNSNVSMTTFASGGWGADNLVGFTQALTNLNPNQIFYNLGGNDFMRNKDADKFKTDLYFIIDTVVKGSSKLYNSYIANIYGVSLWDKLTTKELAIAEQYQEVIYNASIEYNMTMVDLFDPLIDKSITQADDIHLTDEGSKLVASIINNTIANEVLETVANNLLYKPAPSPTTSETPTTNTTNTTGSLTTTDTAYFPVIGIFSVFTVFMLLNVVRRRKEGI